MSQSHFVVDIETTGTYCPHFSMIQIGAVFHEDPRQTFFGTLKPINDNISQEAMNYTGIPIGDLDTYDDPLDTMRRFDKWVRYHSGKNRSRFVSDTTAFDFSFVSWYLWEYVGNNVFGHSPISLNMLYAGLTGGKERGIHRLRKHPHTHNALDDAIGNQQAMEEVDKLMKVQKINWMMGLDRQQKSRIID